MEFLLRGLAYPDECVKSSVVYILAQLSMKTPPNSLPINLVHCVCRFISPTLATAKSQNLTLNLLGNNTVHANVLSVTLYICIYIEQFVCGSQVCMLIIYVVFSYSVDVWIMTVYCVCHCVFVVEGLVKGILKNSVYAQCLLQTDRHTSDAKGECTIIDTGLVCVWC